MARARLRVGLTRHSLTEPTDSWQHPYFRAIEAVTRAHHRAVAPTELLYLPGDRRASFLATLLSDLDVLVTTDPALASLRHQQGARFRMVYPWLDSLFGEAGRALQPWLRPGDCLAFSSRSDRAAFEQLYPGGPARLATLPPLVDTDLFRPAAVEQRVLQRRRYGLQEDEVLFVCAGDITPAKNVPVVLAVMADLIRSSPRVRLLVVGAVTDRFVPERGGGPVPVVDRIAAILEREPLLRERCHFLGGVRRELMPHILGTADVFIDLAVDHHQSLQIGLLEAMSCGLPVVCADWGAAKDLVTPGRHGFRVTTRLGEGGVQLDRWAAYRWCHLLAHSPGTRVRLGTMGRTRVLTQHGSPTFGRRYRRLLEAGAGYRPPAQRPSGPVRRLQRLLASGGWPVYRGRARASSAARQAHRLYELAVAPYASPPPLAPPGPDDVLFLLPREIALRGRDGRVMSGRARLWPATITLTGNQRRLLVALRTLIRRAPTPAVPFAQLAAQLPDLRRRELLSIVRVLQRAGVIGHSRETPGGRLPRAALPDC